MQSAVSAKPVTPVLPRDSSPIVALSAGLLWIRSRHIPVSGSVASQKYWKQRRERASKSASSLCPAIAKLPPQTAATAIPAAPSRKVRRSTNVLDVLIVSGTRSGLKIQEAAGSKCDRIPGKNNSVEKGSA